MTAWPRSAQATGAILILATLGSCGRGLAPAAFADGTPELQPERFFAGATRSTGVLENRAGAPMQRFHVEGTGTMLPNGDFQLDQRISFEHEPPRTRRWVMRRVDAHHVSASLTDASGGVSGETYGNLFHLRYPMQSPFGGTMEQWLYLQPDGRTVMNEATIRVFGIVAAHLSERITQE